VTIHIAHSRPVVLLVIRFSRSNRQTNRSHQQFHFSFLENCSLFLSPILFPISLVQIQDIIDDVNHLNADPKTRNKFAVDSPDGDYDGHLAEELAEVKRLIDAQAASAEDAAAILRDRAAVAKTIAVDAPDGEDDAHFSEEMMEIAKIIDTQAASAEDATAILADRAAAAKIMAVESPDGEVDGHILEELEEVNHIIEEAAKFEDKEAVEKRHDWDEKERIEAEKHPEHDW